MIPRYLISIFRLTCLILFAFCRSPEYAEAEESNGPTIYPRPARVSIEEPSMNFSVELIVQQYQVSDDIDQNDFTVGAYGFDPSVLDQSNDFDGIRGGSGHPLLTVFMILVGLILLVLGMVGFLALQIRLSGTMPAQQPLAPGGDGAAATDSDLTVE